MKVNPRLEKIESVLTRGVEEILPNKEDLKKLMQKRKIKLHLGIDPTSPRLHLGHVIGLKKLQEFAELGHEAILIVGAGTVLAGDPSFRETTRPLITQEEIEKNLKTWKEQIAKVLDFSKVKIKYNDKWLLKLTLKEIIQIASHISAVKLFQREMFQRRLKRGDTIWTHEILYPLLQGYDSVVLDVDLEIGGTDQLFNMLIGRELQQKIRKREKFVLTFPLILGIDGQPMSKTRGNCVWLEDTAAEMFGKIMSIPDHLIGEYFLLTWLSIKEIEKIKMDLEQKRVNPRDLKAKLAREIVTICHGLKETQRVEQEFQRIFKEKKLPKKITEAKIKEKNLNILNLLVKTKLAPSRSEAKRLILQRGVKVDGRIETDWKKIVEIKKGQVLQVGKRKFIRLDN